MSLRIIVLAVISIAVGVVCAATIFSWSNTIGFQSREPAGIKVVFNQMPAKDGVIPIEMFQPTVVSSAPHKLDDFTYFLRNNSGKPVMAIALIKTITYEEGGKVYSDSGYSASDSAFHSDMPGRPFLPESQMSMEAPGPFSFNEGVVIKEIALTIDYVSYADQTAYGSGGEGERRINGMREGARRYKGWLAQEYARAGKSLVTILPKLETRNLPEELKLDSDQMMGADRYRLNLLMTFRTKGAAEIEGYLNRVNR